MNAVFFRECCCSKMGRICLWLSSLLPATIASAGEAVQPVAATSFASLLQVLLGLGLVLGAIAATAWLLRRFSPGQVSASGSLRVVGGVAVGPKERVVLVDVGDTRLVLGVAPGRVNTLHQMPRPATELQDSSAHTGTETFASRLKGFLNKKGGV